MLPPFFKVAFYQSPVGGMDDRWDSEFGLSPSSNWERMRELLLGPVESLPSDTYFHPETFDYG